jgi:DHA2 family multidrug resistance protein
VSNDAAPTTGGAKPEGVSGATSPAGGSAPLPPYFATGWTGGHNPWVIALVVTMATFMEVLDTSIANVSLPHIAGNLSVGVDESAWVLTSYLVSNAIVLPISGWIANRIGRKRFYMICVGVFTTSSALCGFAPSLGWLVFFRVLQGIGGGGLGPSEQSILADTFPPAKRGMAFALYGMAVVLAPAIGPTLGGYITDNFSWRWVFLINVPVGIVSLFLTNRIVTDPPHVDEARKHKRSIDYIGLSLIALGLAALELVLDKGQEDDWFSSPFITTCAISAAILLVAFVVWEWYVKNPIVDVRLFRSKAFASANVMMLVLGLALFGSTILLPQFMQIFMGYSAQQSGMALSPGGILIIFLMPMVGRMVGKVDPRWMIAFGFVISGVSLFYMASHMYVGIDFRTAVTLRLFQAGGIAFLFVPINTVVYADVPPEKTNVVSGIINLARNMGGDVGIAMVTTIIARRTQVHQAMLAAHTSFYNPSFRAQLGALTNTFQRHGASAQAAAHRALAVMAGRLTVQASTLAYVDALKVLGYFSLAMVPLVFLTKRPTQAAPGGH